MHIVYGVSGEGLGHVFEALEIAAVLRRDGHLVKVLTYGDRACEALSEFHPTRIEGLPLYFNDKGLSLPTTAIKNAHVIPFFVKNGSRLKRELVDFAPDVFLTAYEPFTTLMAHIIGKPLISMDNQNALLYVRKAPRGYGFALAVAQVATRICTFGADYYIVKSYRPHPNPQPHIRFVAPIVQREIRALQPTTGTHVLVYLTKPNPQLLALLRSLDDSFHIYCGMPAGRDGNLTFCERGAGFLQDLATCKAIIATTGFSLISDAMYLGKPYFGVPLKKQFEQTLNALFLQEAHFGTYSEHVTRAQLQDFLGQLPRYRAALGRRPFDPAEQEETLRGILQEIAARNPSGATDPSLALSESGPGSRSYRPEKG